MAAIYNLTRGALVGVALVLAAVPANGAGILDAPCAPLGSKYILSDYKNAPANTIGRGHGMAAFVRGKNAANIDSDYLMLVWSMDSGKGDGGISFWNWSQPDIWSAPTRAFRLVAPQLREAHSTPVTNMFANDWRTWVLQATTGFSIYNLDSIAAPLLVTTVNVANAQNTDYSGGAVWFLALAAPYLYVAQADQGLKIYRFTDPADSSKLALAASYPTSFFGHRVNQVWVRGNRIVVAAVQENYGVTVADISNPTTLAGKTTYGLASSPPVRNAYGWTLNGTSLYAAAKPQGSLPSGLAVYELDPTSWALQPKKEVASQCSTGAYVATQDNNAFIGLSSCVHKIQRDTKGTANPSDDSFAKISPAQPNAWSIGILGADNDFPTPFGNALFLGNDHHTTPGSMVLCHAAAADTTKPAVNGRNPIAGATGVTTASAVGLSFTDNLKPWTISRANLPIRVKSTQAVVNGYYSYQLNIVNFRPAQPFAPGTVYEVVVKSGVKDLAGNGAVASTATFTTGP